MRRINVADLFCGAGGTSTGIVQACESIGVRARILAVNHWDRAVETHAANHPGADHHCQNLADLDPRKAVPGGKLDFLVASPECTHHSVARGGVPCNDQSRSSAWCILRWASALQVRRILIENVPEFESWGPLGTNNKPLKSKRGETFRAFVASLESLGYRVEYRVLNAADFGAATSRRRLFIHAAKGKQPIRWPNKTHLKAPEAGLFETLPRWRGAREVIDWKLKGTSIFNRKRPLSENTLRRIEAGLRKFGGANADPFLLTLTHGGRLHSTGDPLPTVTTAKRGEIALVEPFITRLVFMKDSAQDDRASHDLDKPIPTIMANGTHLGLVEPFILPPEGFHRGNAPRSLDDPMQTITSGRGGGTLVEAFIVPTNYGERTGQSPRCHEIGSPLPTVVGSSTHAVVEPFVIPYYGTGVADSTDEPLSTVTTKDRFGLVEPQTKYDILFRMLQPHELSAAMGFPAGYKITGNRGEQVKQIGNAVEVNQARALAMCLIG